MDIEIRKLTPELAEDYVSFFDNTPHDDNIDEHKCYCVCWCNDDYEGRDFSTREKRRAYAFQYVKNNNIQGYLAYCGDKVVGWCNANTRGDCLQCCSWRMFMGHVPVVETEAGIKIKSIFCYTVAPDMKRKGIATQLLARVCDDATQEGFDFVEAYPQRDSTDELKHFSGFIDMYGKNGFTIYYESEKGIIMRKRLKNKEVHHD